MTSKYDSTVLIYFCCIQFISQRNKRKNTTEKPRFKRQLHIYHFINYWLSRKSWNFETLINKNGGKSSTWECNLGLRVATGTFITTDTIVKTVSIDFRIRIDFRKVIRIANEINKKKLEIASIFAYSVGWYLP